MDTIRISRLLSAPLLVAATLAMPSFLHAQADEAHDSGKVLVVERELTKPGRDGAPHEATEAAYLRAAEAGHAKFHYVALNSASGPSRALFISSYPSLAAVEAEHRGTSASLAAALDRASVADGDVLKETDASVWMRRDDLSTNVAGPPVGMRSMEVTEYVVKPGHVHQFAELAKMYMAAVKDIPELHWTTYELTYGDSNGPTFVALTALKSASDADAEFAAGKRIDDALGPDGMKKAAALEAACISTEETNLFVINPKMSRPTEEMMKAEPNFWRPKATGTARRTSAAKPASASGQ